jgi:long-subunit fatty acid transport protein
MVRVVGIVGELCMGRAEVVAISGAALALAALAAPAAAGGFGIPEVGVRRTAMASVIGRPDDASAIYHNPAGLVLQHGWQLYASLGVSLLDTRFELAAWQDSDRFVGAPGSDGYYPAVRPSRAFGVVPMIAATAELLPDRLVIGAAVFVGNATGAAFDEAAVTRYHLIDGYVIAPQAVLAAAYRFSDAISLGASLGVIDIRIHERRDVFPVIEFNGARSDVSGFAGTRPELVLDASGWAPTWMVAAFGRPLPAVSWGATVTGRVNAALSGPIQITLGDDALFPGDVMSDTATTHQLLPWTFTGGGNVDATPNVEIGAELRYWLYRQYRSQRIDGVPYLPGHALEVPKNYHDSWEASGGIRVHDLAAAPALELMLGTQYDRSPAPPRTVTLDQPSFSHWAVHGGLRYRVGRYRVGASYIHYWYDIPTITSSVTDPPSNIRGSGGNHIITTSIEVVL